MKIRFILRFCPESFELSGYGWSSDLLTLRKPSHQPDGGQWQKNFPKVFNELTAAGTVPDLHGIPNYAVISEAK